MERAVTRGICDQAVHGKTDRIQMEAGYIVFYALLVIITAALLAKESSYLQWNFHDPEMAVVGTFFHAFEWLFVRLLLSERLLDDANETKELWTLVAEQ